MKFKLILIMILLIVTVISAEEQKDSVVYGWIPKAVAGLNISQIALSNWTQGGENSISWTLLGDLGIKESRPDHTFENSFKFSYGRTKLGSRDFRTNENELNLETIYIWIFGWAVNPYVANTVRSAITKGYKYDGDAETQIVDFFDPGYLRQSAGITYDRLGYFKTRIGVAFEEVFSNQFRGYTDDPDTPDEIEAFKFDTGIESVTELEYPIEENMLLKSRLELFSRFKELDVWDVRWDNLIVAKINKFVNVNFLVSVIYRKDQTLKTQLKEALQLGIVYNLF